MKVLKEIGRWIMIPILFVLVGILSIIDWIATICTNKKHKSNLITKLVEPPEPRQDKNLCAGCTVYPNTKDTTPDLCESTKDDVYLPPDHMDEIELDDATERAEYLMGIDRPLKNYCSCKSFRDYSRYFSWERENRCIRNGKIKN